VHDTCYTITGYGYVDIMK